MILTSTVFDRSTRVTDRRTDRQNCCLLKAKKHVVKIAQAATSVHRVLARLPIGLLLTAVGTLKLGFGALLLFGLLFGSL